MLQNKSGETFRVTRVANSPFHTNKQINDIISQTEVKHMFKDTCNWILNLPTCVCIEKACQCEILYSDSHIHIYIQDIHVYTLILSLWYLHPTWNSFSSLNHIYICGFTATVCMFVQIHDIYILGVYIQDIFIQGNIHPGILTSIVFTYKICTFKIFTSIVFTSKIFTSKILTSRSIYIPDIYIH